MVAFEGVIRQAFRGDSEVIWGDSLRFLDNSEAPLPKPTSAAAVFLTSES